MKKRICRFLGLLVLMGGLCSGTPAMAQQQNGSTPKKVSSGASSLSKQSSAMRAVPSSNVNRSSHANRAAVAPATGKPAGGPVRGNQRGNLGVAPQTGNVFGGPAIGNQRKVPDALQHAREAAEAAAAARDLLKSPFAGLTPDGFSIPEGNVQGRLQAPDTSFDEDSGFQGPDLNNLLDRFSDSGYGNGMNIREDASDSRKGTGGHNRPMSAFGRELASRGSRTGRIRYGDFGNGRAADSTTEYGYHVTLEHRDASGRTTGYTDHFEHEDTNSRTSDAYNANEEFVGSKTVVRGPEDSTSVKTVGADVNATVTYYDSNGNDIWKYGCDRSPDEGGSLGGPNRNGINISINPEESVRGGNNTTGGGDRPD